MSPHKRERHTDFCFERGGSERISKLLQVSVRWGFSGDERDRTANLLVANQALSQLTSRKTPSVNFASLVSDYGLHELDPSPVGRPRLDYQSQPTAPIVTQNSFPRKTDHHCTRSSSAVGRSHCRGSVLPPSKSRSDNRRSRFLCTRRSAQQFAPEHSHRLADQGHARSIDADLDHSAAGRDLAAGQLGAAQS